ncbi:MAG: hypothetical protein E6J03_03855 [Chloroflexi bacterium]|nr:MAG: hypothetical protein E6J03_03855 [Chloroflexota bacterium]
MSSSPYRGFVEDRRERRRRVALFLLIPAAMAGFGTAVYAALGHLRHLDAATTGSQGTATGGRVAVELPGTLTFAQDGDLYRLRGTTIAEVLAHPSGARWMQPSAAPDGSLVVVARGAQSSDLIELDPEGRVLRRLTADSARTLRGGSLENNHWAFHPRVGQDGTLWYGYDAPKVGFRVDLAVWSRSLGASSSAAGRRWSTPHGYTGGDVEPVPLAGGGVIFTRYAVDAQEHIRAQLWLQRTPLEQGHALTAVGDDCSQPDLAPGGGTLAMVCTAGGQSAQLEVAGFDGQRLGAARVLASGCLCAFPTWAPDGSGLVYLAPGAVAGDGFDLWWIAGASSTAQPVARQAVQGLALDATSRPAWTR